LLNAEAVYQRCCEELKKAHDERVAARLAARELEECEKRRTSSTKKPSTSGMKAASSTQLLRSQHGSGRANGGTRESSSAVAPEGEVEEEVPLEQQMNEIHDRMEEEARAAIAAAEVAISTEVMAMPLSAVKAALHRDYDESRLPMCFATVDELLEVFISVEEGNLFLIQNCQELEEELEGISIGFMEEKSEMNAMVAQRTAQLTVLEENIAEAREKLKALDDRIASLEPRTTRSGASSTAATSLSSNGGHSGPPKGKKAAAFAGIGGVGGAGAQASQGDLSPEELKARIESSIGHMFQMLTAGDQLIKANAMKREAAKAEALSNAIGGAPLAGTSGGAESRAACKTGDGTVNSSHKGVSLRRDPSKTGGSATGGATSSDAAPHPPHTSKKTKLSAAPHGQQKTTQQQQQQQSDASMGPVEMLTIVENKLDEYHRYLIDPANHIDVALIQSVMKQSDKKRRRQARLVHLASQEQAQEERIKRALERSQAPIAHRTGKPVRPRSHLGNVVDEKTQRKAERAAAAMEGSGTSIDSDVDGAEFFR
jgi:hypothetical protein